MWRMPFHITMVSNAPRAAPARPATLPAHLALQQLQGRAAAGGDVAHLVRHARSLHRSHRVAAADDGGGTWGEGGGACEQGEVRWWVPWRALLPHSIGGTYPQNMCEHEHSNELRRYCYGAAGAAAAAAAAAAPAPNDVAAVLLASAPLLTVRSASRWEMALVPAANFSNSNTAGGVG